MKCYDRECRLRDLISERAIVLVRWHDACFQSGPIFIEDIQKEYILETVGILVAEDEIAITIAGDWHSKRNSWRYVNHIPKGMIKKIVRIPIPEEFNKEDL